MSTSQMPRFSFWLVLAAVGCAPARPAESEAPAASAEPPHAAHASHHEAALHTEIAARSGSDLSGDAYFEPASGGVQVSVRIAGAPPGRHGLHIHQVADCSAEDASSAGAHFNPEGHDHGRPGDPKRHLGDLGNITIAEDGSGTLEILVEGANLEPDSPHSFLGRGIIVHAQEDDGSQPSGNAGGRIGCGEIHSP